jgi:DNA ligase-1
MHGHLPTSLSHDGDLTMQRFTHLLAALERSRHPADVVRAVQSYANAVHDEELAAARTLLTQGMRKRVVRTTELRAWTCDASGLQEHWIDRCLADVGNISETCALLLSAPLQHDPPSVTSVLAMCTAKRISSDERMVWVQQAWQRMHADERRVFNQILTGTFRPLIDAEVFDLAFDDMPLPVPLRTALPLPSDLASLGSIHDHVVEWLVEGSRVEVVMAAGRVMLWTTDHTIVHHDEITAHLRASMPSTTDMILDAMIVERDGGAQLVVLDLLRYDGVDQRNFPFTDRRHLLRTIPGIRLVQELECDAWSDLADHLAHARDHGYGGIVVKQREAWYHDDGALYAQHVAPYTLTAVLTYVQFLSEYRTPSPLLQCTFSVWKGTELVPLCKIDDTLRDEQAIDIAAWARKNIVDRFGPIRQVEAVRVFEIGCTQVAHAPRKKSTLQLRNAHVIAERTDVRLDQISTIESILRQL